MKKYSLCKMVGLACVVLLSVSSFGCGSARKDPKSTVSGTDSTSDLSGTETVNVSDLTSGDTSSTEDSSNGNGKTTSTTKTTSTNKKTSTTASPKVDLKGRIIKIGSVWGEQYNLDPGQSAYSDAYRKKIKELEKKYNCTINVVKIDPDNCTSIIANSVQANTYTYDLVETSLIAVRTLARAKVLLDQTTLKDIKLKDARFMQSINESVTFNGKVYGSGFVTNSLQGVFFNKRILKENKQPDIYALYDSGKWTWDEFEKICKATTKHSNIPANCVYGLSNPTVMLGMSLTANAGATVSRNASGKYVIDMASEQGVYAMNWVRKLMFEDGVYYFTSTDYMASLNYFAGGQATFFPFYAAYAQNLSNVMIDEYGFVAMPKGPAQSSYICGQYNSNVFVFPKNVKKPNDLAKVYYDLASISDDLWKAREEQYANWGFDEKSLKILKDIAYKYMRPEFSGGPDYSAFVNKMNDSVYKRSGNPASTMASVKSQFQKAVDDYYNAFN